MSTQERREAAQDEPRNWTIAYRKPRANKFHRVTDWQGTWQQAVDQADRLARAHPELQVYYVATKAAEDAGYVTREDSGVIAVDNGRRDFAKWPRVRLTETGTIGIIPEDTPRVRHAVVSLPGWSRSSEVRAYLPENYGLVHVAGATDHLEISGHDVAGWTLEYVIDRLASGLIGAHEVLVTPTQIVRAS